MNEPLLDRAYQRELLEQTRSKFPAAMPATKLGVEATDRRWCFNAAYLAGHGLVNAVSGTMTDGTAYVAAATITSKGIDFLEADGGLSAIMGVVTIQLHDDTIKALIAQKVQESSAPEPVKKRMLDLLRSLPADATKHVVLELLSRGLDYLPAGVQWLETMLENGAGT